MSSYNIINCTDKLGKIHGINYKTSHELPDLKIYVGNIAIMYIMSGNYLNYTDRTIKTIENLSFKDKAMENEMKKYLPVILESFETKDGKYCIILEKTIDVLNLKDFLNYFDGYVPARHVCWIMSGLYNIACYLQISEIFHGGISLENIFISPYYHGVCLFGGWWNSEHMSEKYFKYNRDLDNIKKIGRQLLGETDKKPFEKNTSIPNALYAWLTSKAGLDAIDEYKKWDEVLYKSYGEKKFIKLNIDNDEFYEELNNK